MDKLPSNLTININIKGLIAAVILIAAGILFFLSFHAKPISSGNEIAQIKSINNLTQQVSLYKKLIERVGAQQAQEDLAKSGLPFTGQTHLLNHTAGEYLYKNEGVTGLANCKEYFLASCYHGFILNAIGTGGIPEVAKVMEECRKEGINTVYPQCSHAVGHGFLAYVGYKNLIQALQMCDDMVKSVSDFPPFNCHDGIFMENIWALHDGGGPSPDRWVKQTDPVYPCNDSRIEEKYLLACWSNQPALMYQLFQGDIKKVADQCDKIKEANLKEMCYNGLSRQIHPIAAGNLDQTFNLCGLLGSSWINYCIVINDNASFAVGDRSLPFAICAKIDSEGKNNCYQGLVGMINVYAKNDQERQTWCDRIEDETWRTRCRGNPR